MDNKNVFVDTKKQLGDFILNADGRCDQPILENNLLIL